MKFRYVGQAGFKDLDLCIAGITSPKDVLIPDTIIEIPDTEKGLIKRVKANGNYEVVHEKPNFKKSVKKETENDDKGDDE